jgi:signal transduction histidine kinase
MSSVVVRSAAARRPRIAPTLAVVLVALVTASTMLTGILVLDMSDEIATGNTERRLRDVVRHLATSLDADALAALQDPAQISSETYQRAHDLLGKAVSSIEGAKFAYIVRKNTGVVTSEFSRYVFVVDGLPFEDKDFAPVGTVMTTTQDTDALHRVWTTGQLEIDGAFVTDQWGTWLSGYVPLRRKDGTFECVLGVDISAAFVKEERSMILRTLSSAYLVSLLLTAFVVSRVLRVTRAHDALLVQVEQKNVELTDALARAEESTRLKSAFLANTSHELRTPLNSIINVPAAVLDDFAPRPLTVCGACDAVFDLPAEDWTARPDDVCPACQGVGTMQRAERPLFTGDAGHTAELLRSVQQSGRHLLAVVSDILDVSKLEAGQMTVHPTDVTLAALLSDVRLSLEPLATPRGIRLVVDDAPADLVLRTDETRLTQVLINLVGNAIKFSPDGGVVVVRVAAQTAEVALAVVDQGIGIAPADHARIFEDFVQVDGSHTRKAGGTGLGLAITRRLVTLLGGTVRVDSAPGQGATFTVSLPRGGPPPALPPHA